MFHGFMGVKRGELSTETTWERVRWVRGAGQALEGSCARSRGSAYLSEEKEIRLQGRGWRPGGAGSKQGGRWPRKQEGKGLGVGRAEP